MMKIPGAMLPGMLLVKLRAGRKEEDHGATDREMRKSPDAAAMTGAATATQLCPLQLPPDRELARKEDRGALQEDLLAEEGMNPRGIARSVVALVRLSRQMGHCMIYCYSSSELHIRTIQFSLMFYFGDLN
jgi:hypothetical protein